MSDPSQSIPAGSHREEREVPVIPGYQIEAVAGETTSTQSWEALQISLDRRVVLLTLKVELVDDPAKVAHFEDVARIVARLHHRNIVSIIDIAKTATGLPYVVMEKIEGRRLSEVLHNDGPLPPERAAKVVLQLADALDGAWKQSGFVHRNLKPDNVYVLPDGAAKISSFMYATVIRPGADPLAADGGMLVGTPNYMPPEQIDCLRSIDFHADIYSVGALFYQALTGQAPFREEHDYMQIFELQKEGTIPAPSDLDPKVPVAFSRIVQKMMAKRPGDRYAFWQDVIEDVQRALAGRDLYVPGGGAWVSPRSTVADAAPPPEPEPEPAAAKGKAKGLKVGAAGLKLPGRAAAAVPAAPRIRTAPPPARKPAAPAHGSPASPLRAAPPIRAAAPAPAVPAEDAATKPRIAINAALGAVPASDGGTRRSGPVASETAANASGDWATPESAYVPPAGAKPSGGRRAKNAGAAILARLLAFLTIARPPLLVRLAGSVVFVAVLFLAMWWRVGALESVPAADPRDPSSIKAVPARVGKALPASKPITATLAVRAAPKPATPAAKPAEEPVAPPAVPPAEELPPDAAAIASGKPDQPAQPDAVKRRPKDLYEDALFEIVRNLRRKPWADAKSSSVRALKDVAAKVPAKAESCNAIAVAFGRADSWEDLVGSTLFEHPRKREVTIGRTRHTIIPTGTLPGTLICDRIVNGTTIRNQKLPLAKMDNRQKWAIVRPERPDADPEPLFSRAFLTLAYGSEREFRALVDRHQALEPMKAFYLVYELDRK